jgi:hypothetical protein
MSLRLATENESGCTAEPRGSFSASVSRLTVRPAGSDSDAQHVHNVLLQIWEEVEAIITEASAEDTLPLNTLKGLYIPLEGIRLHLVEHAGDTLLD